MSASYLAFRARMLSINPLTDLAELCGEIALDIHNRRKMHRRDHYEGLARDAQPS